MQTKSEQLLDVVDRIKNLPPEKLQTILSRLPSDEKAIILELLTELEVRKKRQMANDDFMEFVHAVWPTFIEGKHHIRIAKLFEQIASGKITRLIINLPPRHTKSEFASYLFPAWYLGKFPHKKIIQASHTAELAVGFGRKVRNLVDSEDYRNIFQNVALQTDSKAAGRWNTNFGGDYNAIGTLGALAGKGADLLIIDDPISEQEALSGLHNPAVHNRIYEWYTSGPRQRLQPNGSIVIVQCVEENQRVLLSDGIWKPIRDIKVGEEVVTYHDNRPTPQKVVNVIDQGEDDLLEIVSSSCTVKVNTRHPFLVVEGGLDRSPKTQEDVTKSRSWGLVWKTAGELNPQDMVVTIKSLGNSSVSGHRPARMGSPRQFTQDEYWLFGYLFGDGWLLNSGKRGVVGFCIAASNHLDIDQYVIGLVKKYFDIDMVLTNYGYYRADSLERGRWLAKKGFCSGAKVKRVPEWVFKLRPCDKREFLRGFFVADGWLRPAVRKVETYYVGLANRELLDDLRLLSRTCGVRTTKIYEEIVECQPPHSPKPIIAINYRARFSFKHTKVEHKVRYKNQAHTHAQYFRFERVESVRGCGRGVVYDLTVEGSENFIAEGYVVHNTRWSQIDLTGQVLRSAAMRGSNEWTVVEFPAILPSGEPLWPEFWSKEAMEAVKAELPTYQWNAQYQQNPTGDNSAIIKRDWWKWWEETKPPKCDFVIQSWDTAHETKNVNDYSACTTWGVWYNDEDRGLPNIILLNAFRERLEFPELKKVAFNEWKEWEPDSFLVEKKAAGAPLIQEFRAMGISVQEFSPGKGQDKISRLNAVSDIFASGKVWVPRTRWAEEVVDEVASFPAGEHDDYTDSMTLALSRFRQGGYMQLPSDEPEPIQYFKSNRKSAYY